MIPKHSWTEHRVEQLTRLWRQGLSATQIAERLGGVTRNAVLGKVHRLGLPGRPAGRPRPAVARTPRPPRSAHVRTRRTSLRTRPTPLEEPGSATVLTLAPHACRWPIGDPKAADFTLCGAPATRGAYCERHAARAYRSLARKPPADHLLILAGLA